MRPEPPDPDFLPNDVILWAHEHRQLLELVVDELLATGAWPLQRALTRRLAREGEPVALATVFQHMPKPVGFVENHSDQIVLLLFGLRMTHGGHKLLAGFAGALRLAVERYDGDDSEPVITRSDVAADTVNDDPYVRALSEILLREAAFLGGGEGGPDDNWRREVTDGIVRYWEARTAEEYLEIRATELQASPQLGWQVRSDAGLDARAWAGADASDVPMTPTSAAAEPPASKGGAAMRDAFVSHAGEDKDDVARPLAKALEALGHTAWFDEDELVVGDSLSESIDWGLAHSRFGVVVLSSAFFAKPWPRRELRGLVAREIADRRGLILPVWHGIDERYLAKTAPALADLRGVTTDTGIEQVAAEVSRAISKRDPAEAAEAAHSTHETARSPRRGGGHPARSLLDRKRSSFGASPADGRRIARRSSCSAWGARSPHGLRRDAASAPRRAPRAGRCNRSHWNADP